MFWEVFIMVFWTGERLEINMRTRGWIPKTMYAGIMNIYGLVRDILGLALNPSGHLT